MVRLRPKPHSRATAASKSAGLAGKSVQLEIMLRHLQPRIWCSF